jgi:serine/threonine protein kinase
MDAFEELQVIGRGSFGSAILVRQRTATTTERASSNQDKQTTAGRLFVIKQIPLTPQQQKQQQERDAAASSAEKGIPSLLAPPQRSLLNEVHILMRVGDGHPNICRYRSSFLSSSSSSSTSKASPQSASSKPPETLMIVVDWYAGGDLSRRIKQRTKQIAAAQAEAAVAAAIARSSSSASSATAVPVALPPSALVHFPEDTILDYLTQLALGLKHIHSLRVLHRDLKCSNIFISLERARSFHRPESYIKKDPPTVEVLRIGDFGIARMLDSSNALASTRIGTPYFLSPEVCQGNSYSSKADMWSLGCVMYEMLTGRHAFTASNLNALVLAIMRGTYAPIPALYSEQVHLLLNVLLQRDPARRPCAHQLLSLPCLRERIPFLLSSRRIQEEFGVKDVRMMEEWKCEKVERPIGMASAVAVAEQGQEKMETSTTAAASSPRQPSSTSVSPSVKRGPPSSLLTRVRHTSSASIQATFASSSVSAASPREWERKSAQRSAAQQQHQFSGVPLSSSFASNPHAHHAASSSDGMVAHGLALSRPHSYSSGGSTSTPSTPSPLPTLLSKPLVLREIPTVAAKEQRMGQEEAKSSVAASFGSDKHAQDAVVATAQPEANSFAPPSQPPPVAASVSSWTLVERDSASSVTAVSASPPAPSLIAPVPDPAPVTAAEAQPHHSTFVWNLPSSVLSHPHRADSLTLQCEQVRVYLEQQLPLPILRQAYHLLTQQTDSANSTGGASSASITATLQLLHLGQTHLISTMQQLLTAERTAEERINERTSSN